jgi:5'-methylthioadenosine phosphorylase
MTNNNKIIKPKIAIIGGSGLDDPQILENHKEIEMGTPYGETSSVLTTGKIRRPARHASDSVAGEVDVVILSRHGKGHTIMPTNVPFRANIWALKEIGCTHIIATTACGSLREEIKPRDLIFLDQFIDFTKHRTLTFYEDKVVHTPMADPFCKSLREKLIQSAKELDIEHHEKGTMVTIEGPRFSTRAESLMFQKFGADVINMSTVPEVILARELGLHYASIAMSTDYDCWKEGEESVTWEMILEVMKHNSENVKKLLLDVIPKIGESECNCS